MTKPFLFVSFFLLLLIAGCVPDGQTSTDLKEEFSNIHYIKVKGDFCEISVEVSEGEKIELSGRIEQIGSGSGFNVKYQETDGVLKVWVDKPLATLGNAAGKLRFKVPASTRIKLSTETGDIYVEGLAGEKVKVKTNSGDLFLSDIQTQISAKSVSGDIEIHGQKGETKVKSASGDVQLHDLEGDVKAITTSGDINLIQVAGSLRLEAGSGEIKGGDVQITGHSNIETYSGNIKFRLNDNVGHPLHLQLTSKSGNIIVGDSLTRKNYDNGSGDWALVARTKLGDLTVH